MKMESRCLRAQSSIKTESTALQKKEQKKNNTEPISVYVCAIAISLSTFSVPISIDKNYQ